MLNSGVTFRSVDYGTLSTVQDQSALYYDFTRTHRRGCVTLTHTLINITPLVSTEYFDDYSTAVAATWLRYRPGQATKGVKGLGALGFSQY